MRLVENLMDRLKIERRYILGCEADGTQDSCLLTRYFLFRSERFGNLYLHIFHRPDADRELHDHPWSFLTIPIWPGYIEQTERGRFRRWPLVPLWRPAKYAHRVETINGGESLSLVWVTGRKREWGFYTAQGWMHFQEFFKRKGC
jgi:hypothetical protein